jgi:NAD(P)-dependent dehydrogenase (short-subunit alcohol dehydrogenase family)
MALQGSVAVVTGGSQGIGQGICLRLAREGAHVAILDRQDPATTLSELRAHGAEAVSALADVSDQSSVEDAFDHFVAELGPPSILVNAAGIFADVPFLDTSPEVWDAVMNINARGVFLCSQAAARRMLVHKDGRIINILSTAAAQAFALESAYCASKGAALLLTRVMAVELAQYGISVNGVGPGTVRTPMGSAYLRDGPIAAHELSRTPMGRLGEPRDIAEAVAFFAGAASWVTGQVLYVDGGFIATGLPVLEGLDKPASAAEQLESA